ncbi:OLC1v1005518C1 [Oldenlandia corymbosa var. corymbosa]|uniref:Dirigent protein n=1 Tax=Oldenlandia corymbosa var. corymbosa TaxID=529605 RepID=A0AAV1DEU9_OLDCO|nr:OLC1v1005518C1 [Oldenlandia corymbosa var. corymbosa]
MATNFPLCATCILAMFAFTTITASCPSKVKKLTVYIQDVAPGAPNATSIVVTGDPSTFSFGTIIVSDDPLTIGVERNSTEIGRAQGIYVVSSKDGLNYFLSASFVFNNNVFNGSTLEIEGDDSRLSEVREYAITGGTRKFRGATGYVTFQTVSSDPSTKYSVRRCDLKFRYGNI